MRGADPNIDKQEVWGGGEFLPAGKAGMMKAGEAPAVTVQYLGIRVCSPLEWAETARAGRRTSEASIAGPH